MTYSLYKKDSEGKLTRIGAYLNDVECNILENRYEKKFPGEFVYKRRKERHK